MSGDLVETGMSVSILVAWFGAILLLMATALFWMYMRKVIVVFSFPILAELAFLLAGGGVLWAVPLVGEHPGLGAALSALGLLIFLSGQMMALRSGSVPRMLAYGILAGMGEIVAVLGIASPAAVAGVGMQLLTHTLAQGLMFLGIGAAIFRLGRHQIDAWKGVGKAMPVTGLCLAVGALSIMGLPPFAGFFSKFMLIHACIAAGQWPVAALLLAGSLIAVVCYGRILRILFFETYEGPAVADAPLPMLLAMEGLAVLVFGLGLFPNPIVDLVRPITDWAMAAAGMQAAVIPHLAISWPPSVQLALAGGLASFLIGRRNGELGGWVAFAFMLGAFAAVLGEGGRGDGLSFWFAMLAAGMGALNLLYSVGYMRHGHGQGRYYLLFLFTIGGVLGLTAADDLIGFLLFWEIIGGWALYCLALHEETADARREAGKYFLFSIAGASVLFLGVAVLGSGAGGFTFTDLARAAPDMPAFPLASGLVLMLAGFVMKMALPPLRVDYQMHPAAMPTPVAGFLSSVLLKCGPYGVLKISALMGGALLLERLGGLDGIATPLYVLAVLAALTILYAGAKALVETGIKRLLTYATVCQLGYIMLGLSLGSALGVAGGMMHLVNHMLLKDILYLAVGVILAQAHVSELDQLGGLGRRMPWTMGMMLFAGLSIAGIPPLNGFVSKWLIFQACLQSGHYLLGLAAMMGSLFTLAAILKLAYAAFMGQPGPGLSDIREAPVSMLIPMGVLTAGSVLVGLFPGLVLTPVADIQQALGLEAVVASPAGPLPGPGGWSNLTLTVLMALFAIPVWLYTRLRDSRRKLRRVHLCGNDGYDLRQAQIKSGRLYDAPGAFIRSVLPSSPAGQEGTPHG